MIRKCDSLLDLIRDSTLVRIAPRAVARAGAAIWAQLELALPGAMKDRVALQMVEDAEASGALRPGGVIVESSSGTLGEGLARVGALKGYRVIIVSDPRLDDNAKAKLRALGAELEIVDEYDAVGGWQSARLRRLRDVMARTPRAFWMGQYDSPSNPRAYEHVARLLAGALPNLSALVGTVGSGGSLCGMARTLRESVPHLRVVAVDAVGSVLFHQPNRTRLQSGNGNSLIPGNVGYGLVDEVHWVADGEAFAACRELARRTGIFAGGSSGAAYLVASWVAERFEADGQVAVILPDRGDRYVGTVYSDGYLEEHGVARQDAAAEPLLVRYGLEAAERWSYAPAPRDGHVPYYAPSVATSVEIAETIGLSLAGARS
jgi:cysteine synthase A